MLTDLSLLEIQKKLKNKEISSNDLWQECRKNIENINPKVNAFITKIDSQHSGIPYVLKDCFVTKDIKTTCASNVLQNYVPQYDATVVSKLKNWGADLVGKMNMDAWGHGGSSENTDFGPVKNPWDLNRVAGGSSGGPAVAVATRMCMFAIGEDTGGSIRNPAGWCNITGLKVTYGRVIRYGSIAYASSFDTVGPMAKTAQDCAVVLQQIAGVDPFDATSSPEPVPDYVGSLNKSIKDTKIGIPKEFFG